MRTYILTEHERNLIADHVGNPDQPASASMRSLKRRARKYLPYLKHHIMILEKYVINDPEVKA